MSIETLQQKKEEIASLYLKDLKEELGFLKGGIVGMFGGTIKDMMTSSTALGEKLDTSKLNFREKLLVNISPSTAEQVFTFVKEKQEKIQTAKTEAELDALKSGITTTTTKTETSPVVAAAITPVVSPTTEKKTETKITAKETEETKETDKVSKNKYANIETGTAVGGGLGLSVYATDKIYKLQESKKIASNIDLKTPEQFAVKMQKQFTTLSEQLEKEALLNPKLTSFQAKALSKSAKEFETIGKGLDGETLDAVAMLAKLDRKLPASVLKSIEPSDADLFIKLGTEELDEIVAINKLTDIDDAAKTLKIETILKAKGIKNMNKEVINVLKTAEDVSELKSMVKILTKSKGVSGFLKGIKGIAFLDLISTGFDVRVLCEGLDESEAYRKLNALRADTKREHQWVQFGASVAITAIGIIATCAAAGSVVPGLGTAVGAVVGVAGYAISQAIDIYYDKVEFYLQNEEDFKRQYRTEIKQAIVQSAGAEELEMNEDIRAHATIEKGVPLTTTKDAWKALIRHEEYKKVEYTMIKQLYESDETEDEYKKTLSADDLAEYEKQKTAITAVIDKRMEYVSLFMQENKTSKEYLSFAAALKSGMGIKKIEKILADSKTYYDMNQTGTEQYVTGCTTIDDYTSKYGEKLKAEDTEQFAALETMRTTDQYMFLELYRGVETFEEVFENVKKSDDYVYKDKTEIMQKRIDFIKRYHTYKMLGVPIEEQIKFEMSARDVDNNKIEQYLATGDESKISISRTEEQVKYYFTNRGSLDRLKTKVEVSDDVGQNIIYRIATEIHGYTGSNDMKDLIEFFSSGKENATGLYYDNKRIVNNDRAVDKGIDIDQFETMTAEEILKERTRSNNRNRLAEWLVPNPLGPLGANLGGMGTYSVYGFIDNTSMIDTPTEGMDDKLNEEYRKRIGSIIYEEKAYSAPETKKTIEQKIVDYITTNAKDGGYVELPYYLIIAAKKAKIGDLQKYLFTYKDKQIIACTTKVYIDDKLDFSQTKTDVSKEYVAGASEGVSENAQKYIDYVDGAKKQFEALITYDVNELDIPKEYLEVYQSKITERETVKQSLLTLDASTAKSELESKYQEYHDYFENTYIAMLGVISKFGTNAFSSNDLDSAGYHQQVESIATQIATISIDEKGVITGPTDQMTEMQKGLFYAGLASQKIDGKTIIELAKSSDEIDKGKAIRAAKQIVKSILEAEILSVDDDGNIQDIRHGEDKTLIGIIQLSLTKRMKKNITDSVYFDASKYEIEETTTDDSKIEIKTLTEEQEKITAQTDEIQKAIESTEPDLVYPGRGLVTFDPEKNLLTSRGKSVEIDPTALKIKGFYTVFKDLQELLYTANIVNRFKYKYPGVKDFYFGSRMRSGMDYGIYRSESGIDTQVLDLDTIKAKFPSILDANNDADAFATYINSIT